MCCLFFWGFFLGFFLGFFSGFLLVPRKMKGMPPRKKEDEENGETGESD